MEQRKKLSDILLNSERERLVRTWGTTKPADDLKPIPNGEYRCRVDNGELFNSKGGTPGFKLTLEVIEGEHAGRRVWHDIWLTKAAQTIAKRDLAKLGVEQPEELDDPFPVGIVVRAKVVLQRDESGREFNTVRTFDVVAVEPQCPDPFAPTTPQTEAPEPSPGRAESTAQQGFLFTGDQKQEGAYG